MGDPGGVATVAYTAQMHRFFVPGNCISDHEVTLPRNVARQVARVLRARSGDRIVVLDDSGWEYLVVLDQVTPTRAHGVITEKSLSTGEPHVDVTLYQAVLKADRFEYVLQKGTEVGISTFVPTICDRSVPREADRAGAQDRRTRWQRILTEAAEQSGRGRIPTLQQPVRFTQACDEVEDRAIIPQVEDGGTAIKTALQPWKSGIDDDHRVSVFIGPEGGFTADEIDHALARGIVPVSLGRRVLRAETAGIVAATAILYELGDLGER